MTSLRFARAAALAVAAGTFGFLFRTDGWRADNPFLVPDLVLCVLLAAAAALPGDRARPALIGAFGVTAGVLGTSVASYAVDGEVGSGSLVGLLVSVAAAGALLRPAGGPRAEVHGGVPVG